MTTATKTKSPQNISTALAEMAAVVEAIKNDGLQHFPEAASVGDAIRQGDIYLQKIEDDAVDSLGPAFKRLSTPVLQLAEGNTKGSRHCLASADGVEMFVPSTDEETLLIHFYQQLPGVKVKPGTKISFRDAQRGIASSAQWAQSRNFVAEMRLAGPVFRLSKENVLQHPEHGDWALPPGTYRVVFQRTLDIENQIARVLD